MLRQRQSRQKFSSTILLTQEKKKRLGSSQETKFQGPEETKRRVKKGVNQVDRINKDSGCEGCQQ